MKPQNQKKIAEELFYAGLRAVDPYESVKLQIDRISSVYQNGGYERLLLIGFGKAGCPMAKAIEDNLADNIDSGIVITKYGHNTSQKSKIKIYEAGHPVPDENGVRATEEIIRLLSKTDEKTLALCLVSGGGSALFVFPYEGITLSEKQNVTRLLLRAGADINELNAVRKHISRVKGGRLAEIAHPAKIIALILSDVIGDKLDVIASGPTSPDSSTYQDALDVMEKFNLLDEAPESVMQALKKGSDGFLPETPDKTNPVFKEVENIIIGNNLKALTAARERAKSSGFKTEIISSELTGEAKDVGKWLADKAKGSRGQGVKGSRCLIFGGETTVTVKGSGLGGRNMELALAFAIEIEGVEGITLLSAGTDGTDGPTEAAGAIVDGQTVLKARKIGIDAEEYLKNNDSYHFFKRIDDLFITGPTGTNVMDIQIVTIE